jgi:hypothetical protein
VEKVEANNAKLNNGEEVVINSCTLLLRQTYWCVLILALCYLELYR